MAKTLVDQNAWFDVVHKFTDLYTSLLVVLIVQKAVATKAWFFA